MTRNPGGKVPTRLLIWDFEQVLKESDEVTSSQLSPLGVRRGKSKYTADIIGM